MGKLALVELRDVKHAFVDVSPELLLDLLTVGSEGERVGDELIRATHDPIPEDATAVRCGITASGNIRLVMTSETFDDTPDGCAMRQLTPTYSREDTAG